MTEASTRARTDIIVRSSRQEQRAKSAGHIVKNRENLWISDVVRECDLRFQLGEILLFFDVPPVLQFFL